MEAILVGLIVAGAVVYLVRRFYHSYKASTVQTSTCGSCGCSGCEVVNTCSSADLD